MKVEILNPKGYCAGVSNAIKIAIKAEEEHPNSGVYVLGMLVHNQDTLDALARSGIETIYEENVPLVDLVDRVDKNSIVVLTAHGHSEEVETKLNQRGICYIDATCPFVTSTECIIISAVNKNRDVLYLCKKNHTEANAALSISDKVHLIEPKNIHLDEKYHHPLVISQTTFSEDEIANAIDYIKSKVKDVEVAKTICNASTLRQNAIKKLSQNVQLIYVVGGRNSNNTKTLYEIASQSHPNAVVYMIQNASEINKKDLLGLDYIAISSGASTPREVTLEVKEKIKSLLN